jgi:hypothetical protein
MKTTTLSISAIVAVLSLVSVSSLAAPALAYKDHDRDDYKDLKHCVKDHRGGDISG